MRNDMSAGDALPALGEVLMRNLGTLAQDSAAVIALVVLLVAGLGLPGLV
ncbi:MAG: hypothetical protein N2422_00405 [Rhodobacteraceae bacterium]|nr:hypothetical protein [Paracoccaceae bacterium]